MANLYLYLIRNDNKGVKILTVFRDKPAYSATLITDITILHLPQSFTNTLNKIINQYKARWNTWMEAANNLESLKTSLTKRGITGFYFTNPLSPFEYDLNYNTTAPDMKNVKSTHKTMVQKITFS